MNQACFLRRLAFSEPSFALSACSLTRAGCHTCLGGTGWKQTRSLEQFPLKLPQTRTLINVKPPQASKALKHPNLGLAPLIFLFKPKTHKPQMPYKKPTPTLTPSKPHKSLAAHSDRPRKLTNPSKLSRVCSLDFLLGKSRSHFGGALVFCSRCQKANSVGGHLQQYAKHLVLDTFGFPPNTIQTPKAR